jgi:transcriptional regulator with XRE-family HTH domain
VSVAHQLDPSEPSPLASARLQRKLTIEEAAKRVGLPPEQIEWLEAGRVYRFPTADDALVAVVLYATGLGVRQDEARTLARLPVDPRQERSAHSRILGAAVGVMLLIVLAITLAGAFGGDAKKRETASLLPAYKLTVDVLNGGGDIYYTRSLASKIGALGYKIKRVTKANRFDYPQTVVYFEPGGEAFGKRLAKELCVEARPLPGGTEPRRLVVVAGPPQVAC